MKLLFFSDVHGGSQSLQLLIQRIEEINPDQLILLGDALYHGPRNPLKDEYAPKDASQLLNTLKEKIIAVRGNCDSEVDQMLLEFPIMSEYSMLLVDGVKFFLSHGHHWNPETPPPAGTGDVIAYGHTHIPDLRKLDNGLIAFNPGSLSLPKGGSVAGFGLFCDGILQLRTLEENKIIAQLSTKN